MKSPDLLGLVVIFILVPHRFRTSALLNLKIGQILLLFKSFEPVLKRV